MIELMNNDAEIKKVGKENKIDPIYAVRDGGKIQHCYFDSAIYHYTTNVFDKRVGVSNVFAGIKKVGIIGGSLSSGAFWNGLEITANKHFAWYQVLARDSGQTYIDFCNNSITTRSWFTDPIGYNKATLKENACNVYYIWIGEDDVFDDTIDLGSINDIDLQDYTNNSDTYYGNYAKIIQCITETNPHAKFFLITTPYHYTNIDCSLYNAAIRDIAELFDNCYLIDLDTKYNHMFFSFGIFSSTRKHDFYPMYVYMYLSKIIEYETGVIILSNPDDFYSEEYGDLLIEQLYDNNPVYTNNYMIDNPEYSSVVLDADNKVISGVNK